MGRHRMSTADAAWLRMDTPENLMVVTSVMWLDRPVARADLVELMQERMVEPFPRFRQRVVDDHGLWWEDVEDFDIEDHIHELTLPAPAGRAELERAVGEKVSVPLSWERPLWDLYVVEHYDDGGSATIFRMHHAIADGFSLVRVLLSLTDDPTVEPPDIAPASEGRGLGGLLTSAVGRTVSMATHPMRVMSMVDPRNLVDLASTAVSDTAAATKLLVLPPDHHTVLKGPLGTVKRTVWTDPISFEQVRAKAHDEGVTINDLLLAAVAGALRSYLIHHRSPLADVRAIVPFNLRPLDEPLPASLGNRFGLVYLALPVTAPTHQQRLAAMHERMDAIKHSAEGVVAYGILEATGMMPTAVEQLIIKVFTAKGTGVMTNVPGPRHEVTLAGARMLGSIGWGPTSGDLALGVAIFSYNGGITVGFCVDEGVIPGYEELRAEFLEELAALLEDRVQLVASSAASRSRRRRTRKRTTAAPGSR